MESFLYNSDDYDTYNLKHLGPIVTDSLLSRYLPSDIIGYIIMPYLRDNYCYGCSKLFCKNRTYVIFTLQNKRLKVCVECYNNVLGLQKFKDELIYNQ